MKGAIIGFILLAICFTETAQVVGQTDPATDLKAVLVVGHQEATTQDAIVEMNKIADLFVKHGVTVYKFYDNKAVWNDVVNAAKDCSFFVYNGHGTRMGEKRNAGGICVNPMVSTANLMSSLQLRDNALVLFNSVCFGAGSSADDIGDIGIQEAKNRVEHYAYPFLEVGAAAYYANNWNNGVYGFLEDFLAGITLQQAYLNSANEWADVEFEAAFPRDPNISYSIASSEIRDGSVTIISSNGGENPKPKRNTPREYDIAYVGPIGFSIEEMK